jgi:hypothetical protein
MMEVLIGIDPHKATNAVDGGGKLIELATFPTNRAGLRLLERWGKRFEKPLMGHSSMNEGVILLV